MDGAAVLAQPDVALGTLGEVVEDFLDLLLVQRLVLQQGHGQAVKDVAVLGQRRIGLVVRGVDQGADFLVDQRVQGSERPANFCYIAKT